MKYENAFFEIAAILSLATGLAIVGRKLRQPLLIMFLATGILAGPSCLGIIKSHEQIELLAHMGIALLLFIVGLKLDLNLIRTIGPVAVATGLGQILFTSVIGFLMALAMGMSPVSAGYVSVALTFSSTIIIVKLLSDKKEIDSLHGQIAVGFLIVQDIVAILALVGLTTLGSTVSQDGLIGQRSLTIAVKGFGLLGLVALLMRYVLPALTRRLAGSPELLTLFAIAWAVFLGASSDRLGFSKEVGAFLGGISLASTPYREAIGGRLTSLRDFLLLFFFIDLGARLDWSAVGVQVGAAAIFSLFVLIGNPLIVLVIMGIMGYRRRTGFLAGLTVAQISEFSFIVAASGLSIGHIMPETIGLITLVGVVTISISTYMILYSGPLYNLLAVPLRIFERRCPYRETAIDTVDTAPSPDMIVVGLGTYGSALAENLLRRCKTIVGVDFDPDALKKWRSRGMSVVYGDVADPQIHEQLPLGKVRWVVSTVRSQELNLALVRHLRSSGFRGKVALTAASQREADLFERAGADVVFRPFVDAAEQASEALTHAMEFLPEEVSWPISFLEVRIRPDASAVGQTIKDIPLRSIPGVSIMAVSRAGQIHNDPDPHFHIYPGDRLIIMGPAHGLKEAETMLNTAIACRESEGTDRFEITEIKIADDSRLSGKTLTELRFRQIHGVTVVGIQRGEQQITAVTPAEKIAGGDSLIVIGMAERVRNLRKAEPL